MTTAISADGISHEFPDDTEPGVIDFAMKKYALQQFGGAPESGPHFDSFFTTSPVGRVLDAFGQGAAANWGAKTGINKESETTLKDLGLFNDYEKNEHSLIKSWNEAIIRPSATALQTLFQAVPSLAGGLAEAAKQTGIETGFPKTGEAIAAIPEVLPGLIGVPLEPPPPLAPILREARGNRVIGEPIKPPEVFGPPAPFPAEGPAQGTLPFPGFKTSAPLAETPPGSQGELTLRSPSPRTESEPPVQVPPETTPKSETNHVAPDGRVKLDTLTTVDDVNRAMRQSTKPSASGAEPPLAMIEDLADAAGVDSAEIAGRSHGTPEEVQAKIDLLKQSAEDIHDTAAKAAGGDPAAISSFIEAKDRHWLIQDAILDQGGTPKLAAELDAAKTPTAEGEAPKVAPEALAAVETREQAIASVVAAYEKPVEVGSFLEMVKQLAKNEEGFTSFQIPSLKNIGPKLQELYTNGLLSGIGTHLTYFGGNNIMLLLHSLEQRAAGELGRLHGGPKVYPGEALAGLYGLVKGIPDGVIASGQAFKSGLTTKLPGEAAASFVFSQTKEIGGTTGQIIRLPTHMTAGIHSFARVIGYEQGIGELAFRSAMDKGLNPGTPAFRAETARLTKHPTTDMMRVASGQSTDIALMGRAGVVTEKVVSLINSAPALRFLIPFARMSGNAVRQGLLERTPIGIALSSDIRANLAGRNGAIARDTQIARMAVTSSIGLAFGSLAWQGLAAGEGPSDPRERAEWERLGKQPYSVRIGNMWVNFSRAGTFAHPLGLFANLAQIGHAIPEGDLTKISGLIASSIAHSLVDENWIRGPADLLRAITDWPSHGANYIRNELSSAMPFSVGLGQIAHAMDPYVRQAHSIMDGFINKIPYLSQTLPPKYDIWGQPIAARSAVGGAALTAFYETPVKTDPVNLELARLQIRPGEVSKTLLGVELNQEQHDQYAIIAGRAAKQRLDGLMNSPGWTKIPDFAKRELVTNIVDGSREMAAEIVKLQNPSLVRAMLKERMDEIKGAIPKHKVQQP